MKKVDLAEQIEKAIEDEDRKAVGWLIEENADLVLSSLRPAAPVGDLAGLSEKPCHWGGGNDIIWCSTCGAEYAYAKGEARPACPRETAALLPAAHRETAEGIPSDAQLELTAVREMLLADQGDDDDTQILPTIDESMSLSTMVARCISLLEYRRDVIKAVFDRKSVWGKNYQELCESIKNEEASGGFDAKSCIAENFPQIASDHLGAKAADPAAHGPTVTAEEIARAIATAYGHGHPLGLTSGDGLEYWRANRDRHMKEAYAVLAILSAAHRETVGEEEIARALFEHDDEIREPGNGVRWSEWLAHAERHKGKAAREVEQYRSRARAVVALFSSENSNGA